MEVRVLLVNQLVVIHYSDMQRTLSNLEAAIQDHHDVVLQHIVVVFCQTDIGQRIYTNRSSLIGDKVLVVGNKSLEVALGVGRVKGQGITGNETIQFQPATVRSCRAVTVSLCIVPRVLAYAVAIQSAPVFDLCGQVSTGDSAGISLTLNIVVLCVLTGKGRCRINRDGILIQFGGPVRTYLAISIQTLTSVLGLVLTSLNRVDQLDIIAFEDTVNQDILDGGIRGAIVVFDVTRIGRVFQIQAVDIQTASRNAAGILFVPM